MSKLLDELEQYKDRCEEGGVALPASEAERLVFEAAELVEQYEMVLHSIANIDHIFIEPDGEVREWDDKEALKEIERLTTPIWEEHCDYHRKINEGVQSFLGLNEQ